MPFSWSLDNEGIVVATISAPFTFRDWRQLADDLLASVRERPLRVLSDRRFAGAMNIDLINSMLEYLRDHQEQLAGSALAVIVSSTASFQMARMLELRMELNDMRIKLKVFLDEADARHWLRSVASART
jgi:hypothetical protein